MDNRIVFLDIDGTLLDEQQRTNCDIVPTILDLHARGVRFGLNSNRAWEDVIPVIAQFHLDGPFILENGAYIKESVNSEPIMCAELPTNIPHIVFDALSQVSKSDADVNIVDTIKIITQPDMITEGNHFYMNALRKFSASIHHRFNYVNTLEIAEKLADEMNKFFRTNMILLHAQAHTHGATVTIEVPGVNKGTGMSFLRTHKPDAQFIAIGDGSGDVAMRSFVDRLYAVSNAIPELKSVADKTASAPMTQGVKEILLLQNF